MMLFFQVILFAMRNLLAIVLVIAGAAKIADIHGFSRTLIALGLPARRNRIAHGVAFTICLVEMILGLGIVSGIWSSIVDGAVLILMSAFTLVVVIALRKAPHATCRCFGALSDSQFSSHGLVRSIFFTALALAVFWWGRESLSLQLSESFGFVLLLIVGYLILAVGTMQAAMTIALIKARMAL